MFSFWGRFTYRHRRLVAGVALTVAAVSFFFAGKASSVLTTGGWYDPSSESQAVAQRLTNEFGSGGSSLVVLFQASGRTDAATPAFQAAMSGGLAGLRSDPRVDSIIGYGQTGSSQFISTAGDASWVLVRLNISDDAAIKVVGDLEAEISAPAGMNVQLTGSAAVSAASTAQSEQDLQRAESISLPIALFILVLVFGTLVAAGLPLTVAGLAIPTTLAIVWVLAQQLTMSVFVTSIITMLGLALAIDYSLFMVSRFREELSHGQSVEAAIERTVATSGKAVVFSGSAVAVGLSGLLFFRIPTLSSMGIGGALIAIVSVVYAVTFLPAVLGMLGPRVERLRVTLPRIRRRPASIAAAAPDADGGRGLWNRVAVSVMRHPVAVLVPVLAMLLAFGVPFLGEKPGIPSVALLPAASNARQAWETLQTEFPAGETQPIDVLITVPGDPTSRGNATTIADYAATLRSLKNVARVDGPFSLPDQAGIPLPTTAVATLVAQAPASRPAALNALLAADTRGSTVHLQVVSPVAGSADAQVLVAAIRSLAHSSDMTVQVGGQDAAVVDFLGAQNEQLPMAVAFILIAMAAMLLLQFGSVVLPIKAVVMTLLSLTASFGALVWIFQDGNLSSLLHFTSPGYTVAINPILMFSVIFGLSMDYEVLLLSRIQETYRRTGDNTAAIADGLTKTGRVITGAALIMVAVFAAFGLSDGLVIKSLGIGMAIAVFIDATIIRALLVPATMRLLGTRTWWSPGPLAALTSRLGFGHDEGAEPQGWFGPDRRVGLPDERPRDRRHDRRGVGTGVGLSGTRPESAMG